MKVRLVPGGASRPPDVIPNEDALPLESVRKDSYPTVPVGQWYVPPLGRTVELGRPVPHVASQASWPDPE